MVRYLCIDMYILFKAVDVGDLLLLESLVRKSPEVLSERDESGGSLLHHAAAGGHVTVIQFISAVIDSEGEPTTSVINHIERESSSGKEVFISLPVCGVSCCVYITGIKTRGLILQNPGFEF